MVTLNELTAGFRQLAAIAHARTIRITVGTLLPFEGALEGTPFAGHYNPQKEVLRLRLNDWIRGAGIFDGVVDFDAVLRNPARPQRMRAQFDSGDHLHPGDAGYRKMAEAIDIDAIVARDLKARRDAAPAPSQ
jgi:lysophospholipase L1-like esterase